MQTLRWDEIAALLEHYQQLRAALGSAPRQGHPALVALEEEWLRRAPRSQTLARVADISGKIPDPRGFWYSLMRENGYTRHGYPFQ